MDAQAVRTALGSLQTNPDDAAAWGALQNGLADGANESERDDALHLLEAARERHAARGEADAVARLIEFAIELSRGQADEPALLRELSRVQLEDLFDGAAALRALQEALAVSGGEAEIQEELETLRAKAARFGEQATTYLGEAEGATDDAYQSAMLMRASEAELSFSPEPRTVSIIENLERAVRLDSSNLLAARMLEVVFRRAGRLDDAARTLERVSERAPDADARVAAGVRLARLLQFGLGDEGRAAAAYDRVLELSPAQPDAMEFVSDYFAQKERWDDLVRVYERPLKASASDASRLGDMLQVAMLHWKKRDSAADAEPWFSRIRKLDPANDAVLAFYREYKASLEDDAGLVHILQEAQRALPPNDPRVAEIATDLARYAESQANAHRAIEQYKSVLRADAENAQARTQLKSLYKQTQGHNALVELLRQDLERTPEDELARRLEILREIAQVYREYVKSETALVGVLNQIVQLDGKLDEHDVDEVRELVGLYERLGRHRDLLASKKLLAEIVPDVEEKKGLYRQIGRLWLDQFSNVQHAMESYAALHELDPSDQEAIERLDELYRKRRAWKELYALYQEQLAQKQGAARVPVLRELGQLAAERLNKADDALAAYLEILEIDPNRADVIDRIEKHAERAKNWGALAKVLERRLAQMPEDETRLPVLTKLGAVYAEQLDDAEKAIGTWRRVVEVQPGNPRAMRVLRDTYLKGERFDDLEALYTSQGDPEGLAEVFSTAADRAADPKVKLDLSYRAARVYEEALGQAARAIRSYERILSLDARDARAIERLLPLYEQEEKWARVPQLLESLIELAPTPEQKVEVISRLVDVTSGRLADKRSATAQARRAYQLAPTNPRALELLDATSRSAGAWEEMVQALDARLLELGEASPSRTPPPVFVEETATQAGKKKKGRGKKAAEAAPAEEAAAEAAVGHDPAAAERRAVRLRIARIQGEELGQVPAAIERLKVLGGEFPGDEELLGVFEQLLGRDHRVEDQRWLFDHRAQHAPSASERARVLSEAGSFEENTTGDRERAYALFKRAYAEDAEQPRVLEAVARLGVAQGEPEVAAEAIERHRDLSSGVERAAKEAALAELYADQLKRPADALAAAQRALGEGVEPGRVIPVLSRLVDVPEVRGEAARILTEQYQAGGNARQEADALRAVIGETSDADERVALYERLASVYEEKLGEPGGALSVLREALRSFPERPELWDRAEQLARISGRPTELSEAFQEALRRELAPDFAIELCRRAARHHEDVLGDSAGAVPHYQMLLSLEPEDEHAFARLKEILTAAERWRELEELYDREIHRLDDESRRIEMLAEVALLAEEIMGDAERAVGYHSRILELDPMAVPSLLALDRLYTRLGKKAELCDLLDKRVEIAVGAEQLALLVRSGQLSLALHLPERSITAIERVLVEEPTNYEARDIAEELLRIGSVRMRAARALETVYEARDEIRDLVRVLGVRVEGLRPSDEAGEVDKDAEEERRDLLRRIATLRNDRLHDDEGSFDVFAELAPLDPLDSDLRERLIDSGRRLGKSARVVEVLLASAESAENVAVKGEILLQAAEIQAGVQGDQPAAEQTYAKVLELAVEEPELALTAARALEAIFLAERRTPELATSLRFQIGIESDFDRKRELLSRLAHLCSDVLGDAPRAIEAWEERLQEVSDDNEALVALTDLYEQAGRYADLARVVGERRDSATRDADRLVLSRKLAEIQELRLGETVLAIESYQAISDEVGDDPEVLVALARLYTKAERYHELAEVYDKQAQVLELESDRLAALAHLGQVRAERLDDVAGALDAYRNALAIDTNQADSRQALSVLLGSTDAATRLEAADILAPLLEAEGNHERLLTVLEVQAQSTDDPGVQLEKLEQALRVAEGPLDDAQRAFGYGLRGAKLAAGQGDASAWLPALERLAARTNGRRAQVELLESIVGELFDGAQQLSVQKRVAELYQRELADDASAIAGYEKALELEADDRETLVALEALYEKTDAHRRLLGVIERREELAENDNERKQLLFRRAALLANELGEVPRAIETYESIVDLDLDSSAIAALEALYAKTERYDDLTALVQRRLDEGREDAVALRVKLATIAADDQKEYERALDELEQVLAGDHQNAQAVALLERLARSEALDAALKARAAMLLEPVYLARGDYSRVLWALDLGRAGSEDPSERRGFITRIAQIHEEQREDYGAALETIAWLLADEPENAEVVLEMERLAKVASNERRLAELFAAQVAKTDVVDDASASLARKAGEIFSQQGQFDAALPLLEKALAFLQDDDALFGLVDRALRQAGTPERRVQHYRAGLEHKFDPEQRLPLLHTIAELEEKSLGRIDDAIATHREALEVDERDLVSLDALTHLYRRTERWQDLADLYLRRAEDATGPTQAAFRLALASVQEKQLGQPEAALDQLEEIVREQPGNAEAVARIEAMRGSEALKERAVEILRPLYEAQDDWKRLIKLNEDRFSLAQDPLDRVQILRETAQLWEYRGSDDQRALRALIEAFKLAPEDEDLRADVERLSEREGDWEGLAGLYAAILEQHPTLVTKSELVTRLAQLFDDQLDDPRAALDRFVELFDLDPSALEAVVALERLSLLLADWQVLERGLVAHADMVFDDDERREVLGRLGALRQRILDDAPGAIEAYERAFEIDETNAEICDRLIVLYEGADNPGRLVELCLARVETAEEPTLAHGLLLRAAALFETKLAERPRAIEALERALGVAPGDAHVISELNRLYQEEEMWPELLDNLRLEASTAESAASRLEVLQRIARIQSDKLESHEEALETYGDILADQPGDTKALDAVFALAEQQEHLREQAATLLIESLSRAQLPQRAVAAYELRLGVESEPAARATALRAIAELEERALAKPDRALAAYLRALAEAPEAGDLHEAAERLARSKEEWQAYSRIVEQRAEETYEPELAAELWVRFAKVLEQKLGNAREAVRGYQKACEQVGDRLDLLEQLDRLQSGLGETAEVIDLLERRRALADSDAEQSKLLTRQGQLQLDQQKRPDEAIASLRQALERDASNQEASALLAKLLEQKEYFDEVFDILDGVYRERREGQRLAELHGLRVARATTPSERIDMRRSLSRVLEEDCADPLAAVRALGEGLKDDASESGLLDEMERLLAITNTFSEGAATVLSAVQKTKDIDPSVARELCERAATWFRDRVGDPVATEAALSLGLEYAPDADELLEQLEQLQSGPGRESHLLGTLERRAELALDDGSRIEFLRRAKALADRLEQRERSEALLRRILQIDESDLEALESLTFLRRAAGDDAESFALLVRRTEVEVDGDKVRTLRFEAAELAQGKLGKLDEAIELFERLFEDEPDDARAAKSLLGAYEAAGRYEDVARVIERQMDGAADPALQRELKLALARLHEERFEDRAKAAELYEEITLDAPLDDTAGPALERLYSAAGQHDELARLLSRKSEALRDAGDASGSLALIERLAGLYEKELKQPGEAILAWESAFGQSGDVKALVALRRLHLAEGELPRAAEVIEQLAERSTGADAIAHRLELADLYGKMEDGERVTASLEAAVALAPSDAELRLRLRRDYESSERFDQVARLLVEDAGRAGSKGATVAILREAATLHLIKLEDPSGAADLLARASAATPEDRALSLELCDAYNAAGRSGEAIAVLVGIVDSYGGKRAKELLPIHTRLATAYLASGESARALEELDKAFRIEPGNVAVLKQLGELALETGDHKKAMQMFRALLLQKVEESNVITKAEVFFRVGQVHQALDEGPKAREWYEKAVKADPALDQARDALAAL